jgi:hypothetical protein
MVKRLPWPAQFVGPGVDRWLDTFLPLPRSTVPAACQFPALPLLAGGHPRKSRRPASRSVQSLADVVRPMRRLPDQNETRVANGFQQRIKVRVFPSQRVRRSANRTCQGVFLFAEHSYTSYFLVAKGTNVLALSTAGCSQHYALGAHPVGGKQSAIVRSLLGPILAKNPHRTDLLHKISRESHHR